jgi:hypothetical protein
VVSSTRYKPHKQPLEFKQHENSLRKSNMRAVKLPLITAILLLFGNGSALGLEVDKKIEAPGAPAQIWGIAGDFCAIKA